MCTGCPKLNERISRGIYKVNNNNVERFRRIDLLQISEKCNNLALYPAARCFGY